MNSQLLSDASGQQSLDPQSLEQLRKEQFSRLWLANAHRLTNFAVALLRNTRSAKEDARDIVAETALICWREFSTLREESVFFAWTLTIARRLIIEKHRRSRIFDVFDMSKHERGREDSPYSADVAQLYMALDKLSFDQREAIVLFDIMGFSLDEVQTMQGGSLSGVKSRLKRGRERLAVLLGVANDSASDESPLIHHAQRGAVQANTLSAFAGVFLLFLQQ